jgi:hypothetical protein
MATQDEVPHLLLLGRRHRIQTVLGERQQERRHIPFAPFVFLGIGQEHLLGVQVEDGRREFPPAGQEI